MSLRNKQGFTLIEILIVLGLLSLGGYIIAQIYGNHLSEIRYQKKLENEKSLAQILSWFHRRYSFEIAQDTTATELVIALERTGEQISIPIRRTATDEIECPAAITDAENVLPLLLKEYAAVYGYRVEEIKKLQYGYGTDSFWCISASEVFEVEYKGVVFDMRNIAISSGNNIVTSQAPSFDNNKSAIILEEKHSLVSTEGVASFIEDIEEMFNRIDLVVAALTGYSQARASALSAGEGAVYLFAGPDVYTECYKQPTYSCSNVIGSNYLYDQNSSLGASCSSTIGLDEAHLPTESDLDALGISSGGYTQIWPVTIRIANSETKEKPQVAAKFSGIESRLRHPCADPPRNSPPFNAIVFVLLPSKDPNLPKTYHQFAVSWIQ